MNNSRNIPTILVLFGATGDLMKKKIVPALYHLYEKNKLPRMFHIIGFSRRELTADQFRSNVAAILKDHADVDLSEGVLQSFLAMWSYQQGDFMDPEVYKMLAKTLGRIDGEWKTCANKLFYLAVPPSYYTPMLNNLADSGLTVPCGPDGGWTRVLVEKPFGKDLKTAEQLDLLLANLFQEEQIYRIDHYLAKEMLQNILTFRFSNNLMESSWNSRHVDSIAIRLYETLGVDRRGAFYDGLGALKDVGQNHLLQMLALVTMPRTSMYDSSLIRSKRAEILQTLVPMSEDEIASMTVRGQYQGYTSHPGVKTDSKTETYFKVACRLNTPTWQGVPIYIEAGKQMPESRKEIVVTFKHTSPCLCPDKANHYRNTVTFSLEPEEKISICFWAKKPGLEMTLEEQSFEFDLRKTRRNNRSAEEYERLLLDCIEGNQVLFVSTDEVKAMWRFIDPIVEAWSRGVRPLVTYRPRTWDIVKMSVKKQVIPLFPKMSNSIGIIGLGKMGKGVALQLAQKGWRVIAYNRTPRVTKSVEADGVTGAYTLKQLVKALKPPRVLWLMLPAGQAIDDILSGKGGLRDLLAKGDIIVDAGNSKYTDSVRRAAVLAKHNITLVDIGFSGGPAGARYGACLMVGGNMSTYEYLYPLLTDLSVPSGVTFCEGVGAGHFAKMIHNGIEYGMMQAIGEGFEILSKSPYNLNLTNIAEVYNHGSVIKSRLIGWLHSAFQLYGDNLDVVSGSVAHTGEGAWTVEVAKKAGVKAKVIEDALKFRIESETHPSYTGKIVSALRNQFGGHRVT